MNRAICLSVVGLFALASFTTAQTTAPDTSSADRMLTILRAAAAPDEKLIAAIEKAKAAGPNSPERAELASALRQTTTDAITLVKLFPTIAGTNEAPLAEALFEAAARQAETEVADPAAVEPVLLAIQQQQPAMNKFAWRNGDCLKAYGALLAVYVDNCPPDKPALANKLADIQIRQITAARFGMQPEKALERLNAIDPLKLSREKDRDQLLFLQMESLNQMSGREAEAADVAKLIWAKPGNQFRQYAWRTLFASLQHDGKTAEASALLDEAAKAFPQQVNQIDQLRQKLKEPPATQPTAPGGTR